MFFSFLFIVQRSVRDLVMAEVSPASPLGMLLAPEKLIHSPRLRIYCQMLARGGVRLMETDGDVVMGEPIKEESRSWIGFVG